MARALRKRRALVAGGVARDEAEAAGAGVEAVAAKDAPDTVRRDRHRAPLLARELGADPLGAEAGVGEREGEDPLLEVGAELVRHPRSSALPDPQRLQAPAVDPALPAVEGGVVDAHCAAGGADADFAREREQARSKAEENVIMGHAALLSWSLDGTSRG